MARTGPFGTQVERKEHELGKMKENGIIKPKKVAISFEILLINMSKPKMILLYDLELHLTLGARDKMRK